MQNEPRQPDDSRPVPPPSRRHGPGVARAATGFVLPLGRTREQQTSQRAAQDGGQETPQTMTDPPGTEAAGRSTTPHTHHTAELKARADASHTAAHPPPHAGLDELRHDGLQEDRRRQPGQDLVRRRERQRQVAPAEQRESEPPDTLSPIPASQPTTASVSTPHVSRKITPSHVSVGLRKAARPSAATRITPISPAIENRSLRIMAVSSDALTPTEAKRTFTRLHSFPRSPVGMRSGTLCVLCLPQPKTDGRLNGQVPLPSPSRTSALRTRTPLTTVGIQPAFWNCPSMSRSARLSGYRLQPVWDQTGPGFEGEAPGPSLAAGLGLYSVPVPSRLSTHPLPGSRPDSPRAPAPRERRSGPVALLIVARNHR